MVNAGVYQGLGTWYMHAFTISCLYHALAKAFYIYQPVSESGNFGGFFLTPGNQASEATQKQHSVLGRDLGELQNPEQPHCIRLL